MLGTRWNWQKLFNYGEVICFASAWAVALAVAISAEQHSDQRSCEADVCHLQRRGRHASAALTVRMRLSPATPTENDCIVTHVAN